MQASLPVEPERMQANPHRGPLDGLRAGKANLRIDAKTVENIQEKGDVRQIARDAMRAIGLSQKAFAINAGQTESVISEALSGTRNLAVEWVYAQEDAYLVEFIDGMERARQLTEEAKGSLRADRIAELVRLILDRTP